MAVELTFLILDGEHPKEWRLFGQELFCDFMDKLEREKKTIYSASPGYADHDLRFSPEYASRSSWHRIGQIDRVTGLVIDARSLSDQTTVAELTKLLGRISAKWQGSDKALCKRLGYVALWVVTPTEETPADVRDVIGRFSDVIKLNLRNTLVFRDTLWQIGMLRQKIPNYLENVGQEAGALGILQ